MPYPPTISPIKPFRLLLQREDVRADLLQRAQRLRLVELAREADLVADLDARRVVPGVRRVRQHLALEERSMPPSSSSGTCSVSRRSVSGSYSTTTGLPSIVASNRPRSGSGVGAALVDLADHRRRVLVALGRLLQRLDLLRRVDAVRVDARAGAAAARRSPSSSRTRRSGRSSTARSPRTRGTSSQMRSMSVVRELAVLLAEVLAQRLEPLASRR